MSSSGAQGVEALRAFATLHAPAQARFDGVATLAADVFKAPLALVFLIDLERKESRPRAGALADPSSSDWPFDAHTLALGPDAVFVVEDAAADPRFAASAAVTGSPGVRFYAGATLASPRGEVLGALYVIDSRPRRRPTAIKLERLKMLARIVVDELELARANRSIQEKHRLLELAETQSGVGHWRYDVATGQVRWSDAVFAIYGLSRDTCDPNLHDTLSCYHPDDRSRVGAHLAEAIATKSSFDFHLRLTRADGEVREVVSKAVCELDEQDCVVAVFGILQDVTDQVQALGTIQRSNRRYKLLADNMSDVITRIRLDGSSGYISPTIERLLGYHPEEMAGRPAQAFVHDDDQSVILAIFTQLAQGLDHKTVQHRAVHKDGHTVWVETSFQLVRDDRQAPREVVAVIRDITERRRAADALTQSEARYRLLAENAGDLIVQGDMEGRLTYLSPAVCMLTGYTTQDLIGASVLDWIHPQDAPRVRATVEAQLRLRETTTPTVIEYRVTHRNGHELWMEARPTVVFDARTGRATGFTDVIRDISARKALEIELQAARAEAEALAVVKSEFLANMSHELRTPLTAVLGFSRLALEQSELSETTRRYLQCSANAGEALLLTVNDILDFSKLEAGQVEIKPRPMSPVGLATEIGDLFAAQAHDKGLAFELGGLDVLPQTVRADPDRMRQVLLNLVGNAIKFTMSGSIRIDVVFDPLCQTLSYLVRDTGPGIPGDRVNCLFRRFSQIDGSSTRRHGGTGLGLAICKGLVDAMGGKLGVESQFGQGSCFWVSIPAEELEIAAVAQPQPQPQPQDQISLPAGCRILLADDNRVNRVLVRAMLSPFDVELTEVSDGLAAVIAAQAAPFDAILMDLRMPVLGGADATRRIRNEGGPNAAIPILAFSADVDPVYESGLFDDWIAKPLTGATLMQALIKAVDWSRAPLSAAV